MFSNGPISFNLFVINLIFEYFWYCCTIYYINKLLFNKYMYYYKYPYGFRHNLIIEYESLDEYQNWVKFSYIIYCYTTQYTGLVHFYSFSYLSGVITIKSTGMSIDRTTYVFCKINLFFIILYFTIIKF